ncbi:hypothetical protein EJ05DRAFT_62994 [Pseudovirgaria hyperparasitica]|uniref:Uncharacterized protein n=1 Tax=Pseudovirgaria hyperparasitica TaxID=470096 RepID=A0A6A6W5L9_9PEZI|nr:uncharacterized protein EJ05DRAFT_62994 [Pseudovirgaria hyperparasitica]KAF2756351.1 hypothetical protein EJ05DRAFT_62994 [Pseudovirgaria hyperparasitica]
MAGVFGFDNKSIPYSVIEETGRIYYIGYLDKRADEGTDGSDAREPPRTNDPSLSGGLRRAPSNKSETRSLFSFARWPSGISRYRARTSSVDNGLASPVSTEAASDDGSRRSIWSPTVKMSPFFMARFSSAREVRFARVMGARTVTSHSRRSDQNEDADVTLPTIEPGPTVTAPISRTERRSQFEEKHEHSARRSAFPPSTTPSDPLVPQILLPYGQHYRMWNSKWLRRRMIWGFFLFFTFSFIVVMVLYGLSNSNQGISTPSWSAYYGWTIGPALIFVIVTSFWRLVDLDCRILAPWEDMRQGSSPAARSLLADYTSPILPVVFWRAVKNHHWAVVFSSLVHALLTLTTVFSTGLFMLEPTRMSTIPGSPEQTVNRLQVKRLSVGLIGTSLLVMAISSALLAIFRPREAVSCDPNSIGAIACLLASSPAVKSRLSGLSACGPREFYNELRFDSYRCKSNGNDVPEFEVYPTQRSSKETYKSRFQHEVVWWRPSAFYLANTLITIIAPIIIIAILEGVQRVSDSKGGIVNINSSSEAHVFAAYIPVLLMVAILGLFSSLDFGVSVTSPFISLKSQASARASNTIMVDLIARFRPASLFKSIRNRNFVHVLSVTCVVLASWLSLAASGLYSARTVNDGLETQSITMADSFNLSLTGSISQDDKGAGQRTAALLSDNSTFSRWTYGNLAFPRLEEQLQRRSEMSGVANVQVPATRAALNCTKIPMDQISVEFSTSLLINTTLPWMCDTPASAQMESWVQEFWFNPPPEGSKLYFGNADQMFWNSSGTVLSTGVDLNYYFDPTWGCPSFALTLGTINFQPNRTTGALSASVEDLSIAVCSQHIETVETDVELDLSTMTINTHPNPPKAHEDTVTTLSSNTSPPSQNFGYPVNTLLSALEDANNTTNRALSPFFRALEWRHNGAHLASYTGAANSDKLIAAANTIYSLFIAQLLDANARVPWTPSPAPLHPRTTHTNQTLPIQLPSLNEPTHLRIAQNRGPKITLQVILALLSALALTIYALTYSAVKTLLPRAPTSIAGLASLLADSRFASRDFIPAGSEWCSNARRRADGVFDTHTFSLGWWDAADVRSASGPAAVSAAPNPHIDTHPHDEPAPSSPRTPASPWTHIPTLLARLPSIRPSSPFRPFGGATTTTTRSSQGSDPDTTTTSLLRASYPAPTHDDDDDNPTAADEHHTIRLVHSSSWVVDRDDDVDVDAENNIYEEGEEGEGGVEGDGPAILPDDRIEPHPGLDRRLTEPFLNDIAKSEEAGGYMAVGGPALVSVPTGVPATEAQPEQEPRPELEPQLEPEPEPESELQPEPRPEPQHEPEPQPEPQLEPETQPEPRPGLQPEPQPNPKPSPLPKPRSHPQPKPHPYIPGIRRRYGVDIGVAAQTAGVKVRYVRTPEGGGRGVGARE